MPRWQVNRPLAALIALWLLALAVLVLRVLIASWSDDAYLGMAFIGIVLLGASGVFLLAALLPGATPFRTALTCGVVVVGLVGAVSGLTLLGFLWALASQNIDHPGSAVLRRELVGLGVLLPSLAGIVLLLRRQRR